MSPLWVVRKGFEKRRPCIRATAQFVWVKRKREFSLRRCPLLVVHGPSRFIHQFAGSNFDHIRLPFFDSKLQIGDFALVLRAISARCSRRLANRQAYSIVDCSSVLAANFQIAAVMPLSSAVDVRLFRRSIASRNFFLRTVLARSSVSFTMSTIAPDHWNF